MGVSVIGGLITSTLLSLVVTGWSTRCRPPAGGVRRGSIMATERWLSRRMGTKAEPAEVMMVGE